ncbi:MAG TPA: rhodanese-like domain-containing protein, partial [Thermomicrobiales bacterium]|nr:rhodanese-like domain-containing protein [Thermomicrobiales bacterium]
VIRGIGSSSDGKGNAIYAPSAAGQNKCLRSAYAAAGVTPDKRVISYCSTGVRSATTMFTLLLLGYPDVALYTGSWQEWSAHPDLPRATGAKP